MKSRVYICECDVCRGSERKTERIGEQGAVKGVHERQCTATFGGARACNSFHRDFVSVAAGIFFTYSPSYTS